MDKVGTKVMRPPGGESNNIFGGGPSSSSPEPRHRGTRAHHAPDSDIFGPPRHGAPDQPQGAPHRPHHAAADSNIFGPPEEEIRRRPCNNNITADSGIFGGGGPENPPASTTGSPQNGAARHGAAQEDTQAKLFGEPSPLPRPPEVKAADANGNGFVRVRQPPGGKSSGLW